MVLTCHVKDGLNKFSGIDTTLRTSASSLKSIGLELLNHGKLDKCLEYVHDDFFSDLEAAMIDLIEALTAFQEKGE